MIWLVLAGLFLTACSSETKPSAAVSATNAPSSTVPTHLPPQFPRDEGVHPQFPIEWWYLNSQFTSAEGKPYAFFFCVFSTGRHLVSLYDKAADRFFKKDYYESVTASEVKQDLSYITGQWKQTEKPFHYRFVYDFEGLTVELALQSNKKPFLPGENGWVAMGQKGTSYYYALTDLTLTGTLKMNGGQTAIRGKAWVDHQWGQWDWVRDFSQWKWYSIQLDNGVDVMLFNIYQNKKLLNSHCGYIDRENRQFHQLPCQLTTRQYYTNSLGEKWQKEVALEMTSLPHTRLILTSERDEQFIEDRVLWEGSMKVSGSFQGTPVQGTAFGELNRPD